MLHLCGCGRTSLSHGNGSQPVIQVTVSPRRDSACRTVAHKRGTFIEVVSPCFGDAVGVNVNRRISRLFSSVPRQLPLSPMMFLARGIKLPNVVAVQCPHDADAREHRWPARRRDQDQGFHRGLPFLRVVLGLGKFRDVPAGVLERDELTAARQLDRILEPSLPAVIANGASPFCRIRFWSLSASAAPYHRRSRCTADTELRPRHKCRRRSG